MRNKRFMGVKWDGITIGYTIFIFTLMCINTAINYHDGVKMSADVMLFVMLGWFVCGVIAGRGIYKRDDSL